MCTNKKRVLMKEFIESQFSYCPLIWIFHSRGVNNKINRLHERSLRIVYKDNISSFKDLLKKDRSFTIHQRSIQSLAIIQSRLKICDGYLTCKVANKCLNVRERAEVVDWNKIWSPPFPCCSVNRQCLWRKPW